MENDDDRQDYETGLARNRAGRLTAGQKAAVVMASLFSGGGLLCLLAMFITLMSGMMAGIGTGSIFGLIFLIIFVLTYLYLGLTLFANARVYIPDAFSKQPVKQERGRLTVRMAERERPSLPFSYIVGDYSFAPYMVPAEIEMIAGAEYIVYYAAHSRMFLGIEPVNPAKS